MIANADRAGLAKTALQGIRARMGTDLSHENSLKEVSIRCARCARAISALQRWR
jgi:hypothetical protein